MVEPNYKWIELNVFLNDYSRSNEFLTVTIKYMIEYLKNRGMLQSWHFFREPEFRVRFFVHEYDVDEVKTYLKRYITAYKMLSGDLINKYFFGCHGRENEEYNGEADFYGENVWELCYKRWELGSEMALKLCGTKPEKSLPFHYTRDIHLLENQLGFELSDAITIYLKWIATLMECDKDNYGAYISSVKELIDKTKKHNKIDGI